MKRRKILFPSKITPYWRMLLSSLCLGVLLGACSTEPVEIQSERLSTDHAHGIIASLRADEALEFEIDISALMTPIQPPVISNPFDDSALTQAQKDRLYAVSQNFLAPTHSQSIQVAQALNFIGDYGHPSNMCGPLAMGILRDAGLVNPYVNLSEFWKLNPRAGMGDKIVERTFPRNQYYWYRTTTTLDQFEFTEFPLYTSDIIYIYAGDAGTFEHILTVTRVDEAGRAYTVTNIRRGEDEYHIEELMLYDPENPGEGLFYYWTDLANINLGITGFGGFSLWRPNSAIPERSPQQLELAAALDSIFSSYGGTWNVLIKEVGGETIYARQANVRIHTASVTMVTVAMLFFHALEQHGIEISMDFLKNSGTDGRSFAQLLEAMLVISEERAAQTLEDWVSAWVYPPNVLETWGYPTTQLTPRRSTAEEIAGIYENLYSGELIAPTGREIILNYLSTYTPNDETRLGALREYSPAGSQIYYKRGSLADNLLIVADVAIVEVGEKVYILTFFAVPQDSAPTTYEALDAAITEAGQAFWDVYGE